MADDMTSAPSDAKMTRIDMEYEAEDVRLRLTIAKYVAVTIVLLLLFLSPMIAGIIPGGATWRMLVWGIVNLPLLTLAAIIWHRQRVPDGDGRYLTGWPAQLAAVRMALLRFALFWLKPLGMIVRVAATASWLWERRKKW